jgi:lysophospholipase L1-like esterase
MRPSFVFVVCALGVGPAFAQEGLLASKESWDYGPAMKAVAKKFKGTAGVIVLLGDSITYANQNTAWAMGGAGRSPAVNAFLKWSHAGERNDKDGWHAARVDVQNGRSHTAASGVTTRQYLDGGKNGLPALAEIIKKFNPQMAIYMLGTNDITAGVPPAQAAGNVERALDMLTANGTVPVLSTIPPYAGRMPAVEAYNAELRKLAEKKKVPLLDLFGEMKVRNPRLEEWLSDGVHLTYDGPANAPTAENFRKCGYLLRCYVNVLKAMEVKARVIDGK